MPLTWRLWPSAVSSKASADRSLCSLLLPWQKLLARGLAIALAIEATFVFLTRARPIGDVAQPDASVNTVTNLRALGETLFTDYLLPFEVTSILLLVAMIGAIVLVRKEKRVH